MHRTLKALVAVATGLALLGLTAIPGAATTGTVTAGTVRINLTPPIDLDLVPGGTGLCQGAVSTTLDVTMSTATSGTATLDVMPSLLLLGGARVFIRLGGTFPVTISGGTMAIGNGSSGFTLIGNLYPETSSGSCVPDLASPTCAGSLRGTGLHLNGPWTGTVTPPSLTGTTDLVGPTTLSTFGCAAPYTALNGRTLSFTFADPMSVVF